MNKPNLFPHFFIISFVILWTFLAAMTSFNLPLDVLENLGWGRLWQWGYYKHPPLQAWQQELMVMIFGHQNWPAFLLSFIHMGISFYLLYFLAKQLRLPSWLAGLMPALAVSIYYYSFRAVEFNANVASVALWLAYIIVFVKACQQRIFIYWLLLGIIAALGLLTKYSFAILLFSSLPAILLIKEYRSLLWHYGPYLAIIIAGILLAPHIKWLFDTNFLPFDYINGSIHKSKTSLEHLFNPIIFVLSQIVVCIPALVILYIIARPQRRFVHLAYEKLTIAIIMLPLFVMMLIGWLSPAGLRSFWGYTLPITFLPLLGIFLHWELKKPQYLRQTMLTILLTPLLIYMGIRLIRPYVDDAGSRIDYDGKAFAQMAQEYWYEQTGQEQLPPIIAGDHWGIENVSWYAQNHPYAFVDGNIKLNPWAKDIAIPQKILWIGLRSHKPSNELQLHLFNIHDVNFPWHNNQYKRSNPFYFAIMDTSFIKNNQK
ncbi:MAG: glycosyltransferase family 39 protein [Alphaproteobacteria bacterium]